MNDLEKIFNNNTGGRISKWIHYFEIYDRYLSQFRHKPVNVLEIGVANGGSLKMWKKYFGDNAKIYGVDVNKDCKRFEELNVEIFIGSQTDRKFLNKVKDKIGIIDILIDDGGHTMNQQITTFEVLFEAISENGIYICEDLHTSYWKRFGGGHKKDDTFIEYSKNFIDSLHGYHSKEVGVSEFTKSVKAIHYYDSIIVIEKAKRDKPLKKQVGKKLIQGFKNIVP